MTDPLFDSGVIYAALDRADAWHQRAAEAIRRCRRPPLLPVTTLAEICYFARKMLGGDVERAFVGDVADGAFEVEELTESDLTRSVELMSAYPDIGLVDASIVAMAERLGIETIATVDRRHFASIRPRHVAGFTLIP